eukprot:6133545-Ditylum_brightwellii.AAC.1
MDKNQKKRSCAEDDKDEELIQAVNLPVIEVETNDDLPKLVDNNYVLDGRLGLAKWEEISLKIPLQFSKYVHT